MCVFGSTVRRPEKKGRRKFYKLLKQVSLDLCMCVRVMNLSECKFCLRRIVLRGQNCW